MSQNSMSLGVGGFERSGGDNGTMGSPRVPEWTLRSVVATLRLPYLLRLTDDMVVVGYSDGRTEAHVSTPERDLDEILARESVTAAVRFSKSGPDSRGTEVTLGASVSIVFGAPLPDAQGDDTVDPLIRGAIDVPAGLASRALFEAGLRNSKVLRLDLDQLGEPLAVRLRGSDPTGADVTTEMTLGPDPRNPYLASVVSVDQVNADLAAVSPAGESRLDSKLRLMLEAAAAHNLRGIVDLAATLPEQIMAEEGAPRLTGREAAELCRSATDLHARALASTPDEAPEVAGAARAFVVGLQDAADGLG